MRRAATRYFSGLALGLAAAVLFGSINAKAQPWGNSSFCEQHEYLCTDNEYNYTGGQRIGHDEPAILFYSSTAGAGNSAIYNLTLPKDPPRAPNQAGTGGTFNFQLHPTFWFGMAVCDTQSYPESTTTCTPDSDANIFDNSNPNAADYIGKHPGGAFVEMQFYPPGWVTWANGGTSCDGRHWCAALNIDSFPFDPNSNTPNNNACVHGFVGQEAVNFAFITRSGQSDSAASPLNPAHFLPDLRTDLLMNPGDNLTLDMHDTPDGLEVAIYDNTTHQKGSMTASIANGFAQVNFAPSASTCTATPYDFHPMYATSGPHTRVPWTAHSYNVTFSDEIGHWDYCSSVDAETGLCTQPGKTASDDADCFASKQSSRIKVGGCIAEDLDFDGTSYLPDWPGTGATARIDKAFHATPITFSSPLLIPSSGEALTNFDMQTFEADMPAFEPPCNTSTGEGCTLPPMGAFFYPFFSTGMQKSACAWQFGGPTIAGSTGDFGGITQFGTLYPLAFPTPGGSMTVMDDYQGTPASNACPIGTPALTLPTRPIAFGNVRVGRTSAVHPLKISNPSLFPLTVGIALPSDYQIAANKTTTCPNPGILAPHGRCQYGLTLTPSMTGSENGTATITTDAGNATAMVSLSGTGK